METQDREELRQTLDRKKELEYLSEVENERNRLGTQIEALRRQIGQLTQKKVDLDKEWRSGILSVQARQCPPALKPEQSKKLNPGQKKVKKTQSLFTKAIQGADAVTLAKVAELLKNAGVEL